MSEESEPQTAPDEQEKTATRLVKGALIAFAVCVFTPLIWFGGVIGRSTSHSPQDWGVYGDFVGGLSNPLVSAAALILLFMTYRTQRTELKETRKALQDSHQAQVKQAEIARVNAISQIEATRLNLLATKRGVIESQLKDPLMPRDQRQRLGSSIESIDEMEHESVGSLDNALLRLGTLGAQIAVQWTDEDH